MNKPITFKSVKKLAYYYAIRNKRSLEYHENLYKHFKDEMQIARVSQLIVDTYYHKIDTLVLNGIKPIPCKVKQEVYNDVIIPVLYQNGLTKEEIDGITYKNEYFRKTVKLDELGYPIKNGDTVETIPVSVVNKAISEANMLENKVERKVLKTEDVVSQVNATDEEVDSLFNTFDSSALSDDGDSNKTATNNANTLASSNEMEDMFAVMDNVSMENNNTNNNSLIKEEVKESYDDIGEDEDFIIKEVPQTDNFNDDSLIDDNIQPVIKFD